jgi:hypothetical protein
MASASASAVRCLIAGNRLKYVQVTDLIAHLEQEQAELIKQLAEIKAEGKGDTYLAGLAQGMIVANQEIVSALKTLTQEN